MVEAGGVELRRPIENTQVIENNGRMFRKKRAKSSSDVHGVYTGWCSPGLTTVCTTPPHGSGKNSARTAGFDGGML